MSLNIPASVLQYVREAFCEANKRVSTNLTLHPSMHEESLDHALIAELTATPPTFFAADQAAVAIETHWLGGRRMYGRWEIADIAVLIIVRQAGKLEKRKVALLQTKRLYSREIPTTELDEIDYQIGIGRLADRPEPLFPISQQRAFSFDDDCVFGAMTSGSPQINRIDHYMAEKGIPVYYGFYCPLAVPYQGLYPRTSTDIIASENEFGCRIQSANTVHKAMSVVVAGKAPALSELYDAPQDRILGWTLENFIADEVLTCREGRLFDQNKNVDLNALFYERSAPITAAISIAIDFSPDGDRVHA